MPDPIRPTSSQPLDRSLSGTDSGEAMCVPPKPEKCEAPPNQCIMPPGDAEPAPSRRSVDMLVSRAGRRPSPADAPGDRAGARRFSAQAEAGVTRSGDHYADVAVRRGVTARGDTVEFMSATFQGGGHNELSITGLRMQRQPNDGTVGTSTEFLTAKAVVSTRMLPGCEGVYVAAGATIVQNEATFRLNAGDEASVGLSPPSGGPGFEAGICIRDKDEDGVPETCLKVGGLGSFSGTYCSEPEPATREDRREDSDMGTGGGPGQSAANRGAGGAPGY
jgi:hypothetical protein